MVFHMLSVHIDVCNPCKTMGATSVQRGMRSFWITHMRFRAAFTRDSFGWDFLGSWLGGAHCGKQLAGKMGGTRALRCSSSCSSSSRK